MQQLGLTLRPKDVRLIVGSRIAIAVAGVGYLNQVNIFITHLQIATTGNVARQKRSIGATQHFAALARRFDTQADAELNVGPHLVRDASGTLGGQQQRDALSTTQPGDHIQLVFELGIARNHLSKFINNDEEIRVRLVGEMVPFAVVFEDIFGVGGGIELLAALHFSMNGRKHAGNARFLQIGNDIDAVGQLGKLLESAATLVIDQHKVEHSGIVIDG